MSSATKMEPNVPLGYGDYDKNCRYDVLLNDFGRHIASYCSRHAVGRGETRELVQDVMVTLWQKLDNLDPASTPRQVNRWLHKLMRQVVFDRYFRRRQPTTVPLDEVAGMSESEDYDRELLDDLVAHLDPDEQQLIAERFEGYTPAEMAERHHTTVNTMNQRLSRITKKLKTIYEQQYATPTP